MVQTEDQYIFIHEALLEAATCGNTEVPARNLYAHIQKLTQVSAGESVTAMELEFKVGTFSDCIVGLKVGLGLGFFQVYGPFNLHYNHITVSKNTTGNGMRT